MGKDAMLTRCPECRSLYRVTPKQLGMANGTVRCGHCNRLFYVAAGTHRPENAKDQPSATPDLSDDTYPDAFSHHPRPAAEIRSSLLWGSGAALLALAMVLQFAWWDRHHLGSAAQTQQITNTLCRYLPCDLRAPHHPEDIAVLERDISEFGNPPGALNFRMLIENQHAAAQNYPIIELSLLNQNGYLVGKRRFSPHQYLPQNAADNELLPPHQPTTVSFELAPTHSDAAGFQIDFL